MNIHALIHFFHSSKLRIQLMRQTMSVLTIAAMMMSSAPAALLPTVASAIVETPPICNGLEATIWVDGGNIIHSTVVAQDGTAYTGTLTGTNASDVIVGTIGDDVINSGNDDDTVCSLDGNDTVTTGNGDDWIDAGDGNNTVNTGAGDNTITTGAGNDTVSAGNQTNTISTDGGNDSITVGNGSNSISAGSGNDSVIAGNGGNFIDGGPDYDYCVAGSGTNTIINCELDSFPAIVIVKDAQPDSEQTFDFSGGLGDFSLTDNGSDPNYEVFSPGAGTYAVIEGATEGWELSSISCSDPSADTTTELEAGSATVALGASEVVVCTFTNTESEEPTPGSIEITKYACPTGTTVVRSENGVGGTVPDGCVLQEGATFGYVHGTGTDANGPYDDVLGPPITEAGATNGSGILTIDDLAPTGRYLVVETDGSGNQLPYPGSDVLGLYCEGDGDTSDNNDNQELTFVTSGETSQCVAYNEAPVPTTGSIEVTKYLCPLGTTVNRDDNGVDGVAPEGCELQEGAYFGYVHGEQDTTGAPYPEWSASVIPGGSTDGSGVLTIPELAPDGRYVVFETDSGNNKLANDALLGLYCEGDEDPDPYHNDNGDITFVSVGGTAQCVAYNESDQPLITEVRVAIMKYVDGALATEGTFPMHASWSADNTGTGSGNYSLTGTGYSTTTPYTAVTAAMDPGADYSTYETTGGTIAGIGEECPIDGYRLVGYRWGTTLDEALAADVSYDYPDFTNLQSDMYVIVDNETCACDAEAEQTIYSDATTQVDGHDAYEITPHPAWTASIPGAAWIWSEDINASSESASVGTAVFTQTFTIDGTPLGATLQIATDNTYSVSVNGVWVADSTASLNHFATAETVAIPASVLLPGANEIEISVNNPTWSGTNPAGLLYALTVGTNECEIPQVKVHVLKYLFDGETTVMAEASTTGSTSFPMRSSWSAGNVGSGSGNYTLNPSGYATTTAYAADTTWMDYLADYSTYEKTYPNEPTSSVLPVGATCAAGWYRLEGYQTGNTLAEAEAAPLSTVAPAFTDLQQDAYVIVVNRDCSTVPTSTVTMCKYDSNENPLSGWTLMLKGLGIEDVNVPANTWLSTNSSNPLIAGVSYIATALGEWLNNRSPLNTVDAEYSTEDDWVTHMDGFTGYGNDILDLQQEEAFVDWGPYSSSHIYARSFTPAVSGTTSFRIFDGTGSTPIAGWYGDNTGSLDVNISEGYAGVTGENGCVTFTDVPYGTYSTGEVPQIGWSSISGNGETVVVDGAEETFILVNKDDSIIDDTQAHLTIVKHTTGEQDGTFEFTFMDSGENATSTELTTVTGAATSTVFDLEPGDYSITEALQNGWDLSGAVCTSTGDVQYSTTTDGVTASVVAGEYLTCTFTNDPGSTTSSVDVTVHHGDLATSFADVLSDSSLWFFYNDETDAIDNSLGAFVGGPGTPPLGDGSAQISVSGTQRRNLATYQFFGTPLSQITAMQYSTYNPSAGNGGSANRSGYLQFNVDFDGSDSWQKRLLFEPTANGTVNQDSWDQWNTIDGGTALWTWSGLSGHGGSLTQWPDGSTDEYRTWNNIVASFPSAAIRTTDSWLGIRVGSPYSDGYTENLDRFFITIDDGSNATTTIVNFEPDVSTLTTITDVSPEPSTVGESYTVSWSVTPTTGSSTPTGTVEVKVNGGAGCSDDASVGECSIVGGSAGTVMLQAFFTGGPGYDDSSSGTTEHEIVEPVAESSSTGGDGGNGPISTFGAAFGGSVLGAATTTASSAPVGNFGPSCNEYLTMFLGYGRANNPDQVLRLQYVLATFEGFDVPQDGVFGPSTLAAVRVFQQRYANEILTPWGISNPTGFVYLTTRKKINEIFCGNGDFPLTFGEQAIIDRSRQGSTGAGTGGTGSGTPPAAGGSTTDDDDQQDSTTDDTTPTTTQGASTQVGAAAAAEGKEGNIFSRFFDWLFGR